MELGFQDGIGRLGRVERRRSPGHEVQIRDDMIEAGMHIGTVVGWIGAYSCTKSIETRVEMFGRDADLYGGNEIQPGRSSLPVFSRHRARPVAGHDADSIAGPYAPGPELSLVFGQCHLSIPEPLHLRISASPIWT